MTISIITALFLLVSSYSLEFAGWIVALTASIVLLWTRSTVLSLPASLVRILVAPTLILCLGLHGIYSNSLYDVGKDLWYFSGPVVYISFGYLVFERLGSWQRLVQPLVDHRRICLSWHHRCGCFKPGRITRNHQYRRLSGVRGRPHICSYFTDNRARFHEICRFAHDRGNTPDSGKSNHLYPVDDSGTSQFSRTHIVCLAAGLICTVNPRFTPRRVRNYTVVLLGGAILLVLASGFFHSSRVGALIESFFEKTANTSSEVNVHSYETFEDINLNWRGFEASRAAKTYAEFGDTEKLFGGGFGTNVDLGFAMKLLGSHGWESLESISLLHNGYMELLVKTGLLGLSLFIAVLHPDRCHGASGVPKSEKCAKLNGLLLLWAVFVFVMTRGSHYWHP